MRTLPGVAVAALLGAGAAGVSARFVQDGLDVGLDRNASNWPGTQAEVSIAVDPSDPAIVLAATMNVPDGRLLAMSSRDFGVTWTRAPVPKGDGSTIDNDPMVAFDTQGAAYLARIPAGPSGTSVDVVRSPDGGRTWEPAVRISSSGMDDKVALAVDDTPDSPWQDRLYVAWKLPRGGVFVSRSLDGVKWSVKPVAEGKGTGAHTSIAFAPVRAKFVRITQTDVVDAGPNWVIANVNLYEAGPGIVVK